MKIASTGSLKHLNQVRRAAPFPAYTELSRVQPNYSFNVLQWEFKPLLKKSKQTEAKDWYFFGLCPLMYFPFCWALNVSPCCWTSSAFAHYFAGCCGASCLQGMACGGRLVQDEFRWLRFAHTARSQRAVKVIPNRFQHRCPNWPE